jgi:glycerol-3-phosphate acyltransferase PlsX
MAKTATLILDVMGAELGIAEVLRGAAAACARLRPQPMRLVLVTAEVEETRRAVEATLGDAGGHGCDVEILHAPQQLPRDFASPVDVYKKHPDCSIRRAMDIAKATPDSAVISPATTGLVMTSALFTLGRVRGIERPPIGTPMPTMGKQLFFVDGGSNVDCKARQLYQFAVLAHLYVKNIQHVERPVIALLSNGSEQYKGNQVVREAYELIDADPDLNFAGFTEGHTVLSGDLDIMVCDGFLGNILLKFAEGLAEAMMNFMREEFKRDLIAGMAARLLQRRAFGRLADRVDYARFGGAPLLGLNGNVVICHGRSPAKAFMNAVIHGHGLAVSNIAQQVSQYVAGHPQVADNGGDAVETQRPTGGD